MPGVAAISEGYKSPRGLTGAITPHLNGNRSHAVVQCFVKQDGQGAHGSVPSFRTQRNAALFAVAEALRPQPRVSAVYHRAISSVGLKIVLKPIRSFFKGRASAWPSMKEMVL